MPQLKVDRITVLEKWGLPHEADFEGNEISVIEDKIVDKSRWSDVHRLTIERLSDNKFFQTTYRSPATECQEEEPWQYEKTVVFDEVEPYQKTVTDFRKVSDFTFEVLEVREDGSMLVQSKVVS